MGDLTLCDLHKRFGAVTALDGMSLTVRAGELYGFVGSNGAGKTTAMRIALGVLAADSGSVTYGGAPVTLETRSTFGYMPEERGLYPRMKVGQQLTYLAQLHGMDKEAATAATRTWTTRLGVASRIEDEVQKLSLGNQQRVQLAAALVHDPEILVLDEPFSGLDPVAVEVMSGVLKEVAAKGVPVIFSSHQLDLVERLCDRVGIVKNGQLVSEGTIDELRTTDKQRLHVRVAGAASNWADGIAGVAVIERDGSGVVVEFDRSRSELEQVVLQAALAAGQLQEFSPVRPHLQDLFRHVVTMEAAA